MYYYCNTRSYDIVSSKGLRLVASIVLFMLLLSLIGCAQSEDELLSTCDDALAALPAQEEVRLLSTTLIGETADAMEPVETWEYWISGEDRLVIVPTGAEEELWTLYLDGQCFKTMPENESRVWEAVQEDANTDPWVPPDVDIGAYEVSTGTDADGRRTITLTGDRVAEEEGAYGVGTTSGYRVVYVLNGDGTLASYSLYYTTAYPDANGETETLYWCMVMEYPTFVAGEITEHLNALYEEATE